MDFKFNSLSIASLNVRGIREITKRKALFLFLKRTDADFIFCQETHSTDLDEKFWKSQWGKSIFFSHGTSHSAGVMVLMNRFKGDVLNSVTCENGRWVILTVKLDNTIFILCNIYGHNSNTLNKSLFAKVSDIIQCKFDAFQASYVIFSGDFNECLDNLCDRYPPRSSQRDAQSNLASLCANLSLTDIWRFYNPGISEYTWSNKDKSLQSRIDMFFISTSALQYVKEIVHKYAPLTDHKLISLTLKGTKENSSLRGYWKFNNNLLKDEYFNNSVKKIANDILGGVKEGFKCKWDFFKYNVRQIAVKRSKELKKINRQNELELINKLGILEQKHNLTKEEEAELVAIQSHLDLIYLDLAKGAFICSRAKWLEEGEKNTSYFFALEKRNVKRNALTALNINGNHCMDQKTISDFVYSFYKELYNSKFDLYNCEEFIQIVHQHIPIIDKEFHDFCESNITSSEIKDALLRMKKGKAPGIDGLTVEFYLHFWELIEIPLYSMYNECINSGEMTTTMKQGIISLIAKPDKDPNLIENWRPISLLTIDYKLITLVFANRLREGLNKIISEYQSGFLKGRHITNNIRLVLDLLDYAENVDEGAVIFFLDF